MNLKPFVEDYKINLKIRLKEFTSPKLTPKMLISRADAKEISDWLTSKYGINGANALEDLSAFKDGDLPLPVQKSIIEEAKNENTLAIKYLFVRCYPQIKQAFTSYLGKNSYYRVKKLSGDIDGGLADWITVCFNTLCGGYDSTSYDFEKSAIAKFDLARSSTIASFASFYSSYLRNAISYEQKIQNRNGFTGWGIDKSPLPLTNTKSIDQTLTSDKSGKIKSLGELISDENEHIEDNFMASEEEYEFMKNWQALCKDPDFYAPVKGVSSSISAAELITYTLEDAAALIKERTSTGEIKSNPKKAVMLSELDISSYDLKKIMSRFVEILNDYSITQEEFLSNIKTIGPDIILKYMNL